MPEPPLSPAESAALAAFMETLPEMAAGLLETAALLRATAKIFGQEIAARQFHVQANLKSAENLERSAAALAEIASLKEESAHGNHR